MKRQVTQTISKTLAIFLGLSLLAACGGYRKVVENSAGIKGYPSHAEFDRPEYALERDQNMRPRRGAPAKNWAQGDRAPASRRAWRDVPRRARSQASDFVDSEQNTNLWSSQGQDNFLFSKNVLRHEGRQIILDVNQNLKDEISRKLYASMPEKDKGMRSLNDTKKQDEAAVAAGEQKEEKIMDRIPVFITEKLGTDSFRLRGQKDVLFKGIRRRVEVVGLVRKKDVTDEDTVQSAKFLDYKVKVFQ